MTRNIGSEDTDLAVRNPLHNFVAWAECRYGPAPSLLRPGDRRKPHPRLDNRGELREAGYEQVTVIHDVTGIARRIAEIEPDVMVINLENPNRDMLENMFQLSRAVQRPIAMFVDQSDQASIEALIDAGVSAYVVDGLRQERRPEGKPIARLIIFAPFLCTA